MRLPILTALALMLSAAPALTQEPAAARGPGLLNVEFSEIDSDADGRITLDEWAAFLAGRRAAMRSHAVDERVDVLFRAADADGDGVLTRSELAAGMIALHEQRMAEMAEMPARRGWSRSSSSHMGAVGALENRAERSFARFDANDDGVIVPEEFAAAQERWQRRAERHAERRSGDGEGRRPGRRDDRPRR